MPPNALSLPDNLIQWLSAAERKYNLPAGVMTSVLQQEIGGQEARFLADPTAYHYEPNEKGQRGTFNKKGEWVNSTAFGPFGILESTAKDPGYGITPLRNKSLEEQARFATEYLAARARHAGGLEQGLAGYGQGSPYAKAVLARLGNVPAPEAPAATAVAAAPVVEQPAAPVVVAAAPVAPTPVPEAVALQTNLMPAPADPEKDQWLNFLKERFGPKAAPAAAQTKAPEVLPTTAQYMMSPEEFNRMTELESARPNFAVFQGLRKLGRRA
jgi:hypothetical protein